MRIEEITQENIHTLGDSNLKDLKNRMVQKFIPEFKDKYLTLQAEIEKRELEIKSREIDEYFKKEQEVPVIEESQEDIEVEKAEEREPIEISKPYPNEHACRLEVPDKYARFARGKRKHNGKTYSIIFGVPKDGGSEEQAYRYNKDSWEVREARAHCKAHKGSFEAAKPDKKQKFEHLIEIKKLDEEFHVAYCTVYPVNEVDLQGDWMTEKEVFKAMLSFMTKGGAINLMHNPKTEKDIKKNIKMVAIDCALTDIPDYNIKKGSWYVGLKFEDDIMWNEIKKGAGLSIGGTAYGRERSIEEHLSSLNDSK